MTHRLDLSPELEAKLQALAAQRGADADETVLQVLAEALSDVEAPAARARKPLRGHGKYAAPGFTVEALLQERREEARRESERESQQEASPA